MTENAKICSKNEKIAKYAKKAKKCKIKISPLMSLLHESNYKLGKHCLRLTKKRCILHWNPGPNYYVILLVLIK